MKSSLIFLIELIDYWFNNGLIDRYGVDWNQRPKEQEEESTLPKVSVIIKGDVDGSVEVVMFFIFHFGN